VEQYKGGAGNANREIQRAGDIYIFKDWKHLQESETSNGQKLCQNRAKIKPNVIVKLRAQKHQNCMDRIVHFE